MSRRMSVCVLRGRITLSGSAKLSSCQPEAIQSTDRRAIYVGLDAYQGAGGTLTRDLFADEVFIGDIGLLDQLFTEKLAMDAELIGQGWKWVETTEDQYIPYEVTSKLDRLYRVEGETTGTACSTWAYVKVTGRFPLFTAAGAVGAGLTIAGLFGLIRAAMAARKGVPA